MPIKCTWGEVIAIRGRNGAVGPLAKILAANKSSGFSLVDRARLQRFCAPILNELGKIEPTHLALLEKYGTERPDKPGHYDLPKRVRGTPEEKQRQEYDAEYAKLEAVEVELTLLPLPTDVVEQFDFSTSDLLALDKFLKLPEIPDEQAAPSPTEEKKS